MEHHSSDHIHHIMHNMSTIPPAMAGHEHHMTGHEQHMGDMTTSPTHDGMHHGSGMDHMMKMYFHFTLGDYVLFNFWQVNTYGTLISSMVGIFIAAMLYEGLKYFREYLYWKNYNMLQYQTVNKPPTQDNERVINKPTLMSLHHLIQTLLHIIQIFVSYLLMLIFMTYNVWLCLAVVLGSATGYFLFGWRKSLFVDVTEHCH